MGNCKSENHQTDDTDLKEMPEVKDKVRVMTFAGPDAVAVDLHRNLQPTFSDPVFFSPRNGFGSSFKLE